ncbi:sporulation protein [Durotheca rogersii]|uniref:sporulation protein n=1 Tax=Durotheca rogersii TaxID=419775 RepID=UPI00221F9F0A|nr:sporulation protein [Durotheca rogersii]KAI5863007.1 sporulation protein [Durotheca rogersii]
MAPAAISNNDTGASKRKHEPDDHKKRKRARRDSASSRHALVDVAPQSIASNRANALPQSSENPTNATIAISAKNKERKGSRRRDDKKGHDTDYVTWRIQEPLGGRMLNIDPILTDDEKHLILAYNTSIQVYSAKDSLLVRKIPLPMPAKKNSSPQVVSMCLSPSLSHIIWVASSSGHLWSIDWTNGKGSGSPMRLRDLFPHDMAVGRVKIGPGFRDVVLFSAKRDKSWQLVAQDVRESVLGDCKVLVTNKDPIQNLQAVQNGYALAGSVGNNVVLGTLKTREADSIRELEYEFFTFDCNDAIACLDVRVADRIHLDRKSLAETSDEPVVDIAVGCARGAIFFYNDLLPQLRLLRASKVHISALQPRKYHWHRRAVHSVKWSRDGHYILSGGSETTLVLWQLDTERMDFLPHLSASIENIVVSKHGSSYVLHLDDNSAIVLSTAEMQPTTYVSGIQALISPRPFSKDDMVLRVGRYTTTNLFKTPATVNPADSSRFQICVGNGQQIGYSGSGPSTPMIQTLDLTTLQSISKQALTRTNPTDVNMTTRGFPVTEPRITNMAYSADGKWLATTDEWQPPTRDLHSLSGSSADRREVFLKFWAVSSEDQSLELMSRVNAPHFTDQNQSIHGLAADPQGHRFATIGGDGIVRLWEPVVRRRDGVPVKGKQGRQLLDWICSRAICLQGDEEPIVLDTTAAKAHHRCSGAVSFSEDGSTLACALDTERGSMTYIIDVESGKIRNRLDGLAKGDVRDIRVLSSCLVVLSDCLVVYDLVLDELRYGVQLRADEGSSSPGPSILTLMAVDCRTCTFAVAVSRAKANSTTVPSELAVFSLDRSEPLIVQKFTHPITSIVSLVGSSGYLVLDSAAQLWPVSQDMDTNALAFAQPLVNLNLDQQEVEALPENNHAIPLLADGDDDGEPASADEMDVDTQDAIEEEEAGTYPAVISQQRLAEVFDIAPAFAMPPIEDTFYQVAKLLSRRPSVQVA